MKLSNEQILKSARGDKNRGNEYEKRESTRSSLLGAAVAIVVGIVLFLLDYFIKGNINVDLLAVGMTMAGVQMLYEGIKCRRVYAIVFGIIDLIIALLAVLIFVYFLLV